MLGFFNRVDYVNALRSCEDSYFQFPSFSFLTELRVLLVGWRGAGKSSAGNLLLGCRVFESGHPTEVSVRRQALVAGRHLTVVDTPGWIGSLSSAHQATYEEKSNWGQGFSILGHMRSYWSSLWSPPSLPKRDGPLKATWKCLARRRVSTRWCCFHVATYCMAHQLRITSSGMEASCWNWCSIAGTVTMCWTVPKPTRTSHRLLNSCRK